MRLLSVIFTFSLSMGICFSLSASEAKQAFDKGTALFQQGEYIEAAKMFRLANQLRPNWKILYNLGQSEAAAKQYGLAILSFESYLSQGGDDVPSARRADIITEIKQLREMVGYIEIDAPAGTEIIVNNISRGVAPFSMEFPVAASVEHTIIAIHFGIEIGRQRVTVIGSKTQRVAFGSGRRELESSSEIEWTDENSKMVSTKERKTKGLLAANRLKIAGWTVVGTGSALLVGGAVTGILALNAKSDIDEHCPDGCYSPDYDRLKQRDSLALSTDILLGVGAGLVATGVVMLIISKNKKEKLVGLESPTDKKIMGGMVTVRF